MAVSGENSRLKSLVGACFADFVEHAVVACDLAKHDREDLTQDLCCTIFAFMKNITITVDDEVARWAKVWAAKHNSSVSRLLGEILEQRMRQESDYEAAMKRFLRKKPTRLRGETQSLPGRDELYDR